MLKLLQSKNTDGRMMTIFTIPLMVDVANLRLLVGEAAE